VGDLALAHTEIYADTGAITPNGFLSMRDMNLPLLEHKHARYYNHFPLSSDLSKSAHQAIQGFASQCGCALRQGNFTTLATCTGTDSRAAAMEEFSAGMCENMEGAGVAHMCCMFDTPVVEVRAISNMVQARNLADWDLPEAMQRAQEAVLFWLQNTPIQTFTSQDI
jgi:futalosine hydrolase